MITLEELNSFTKKGFFIKESFITQEVCTELKSILEYNLKYKKVTKNLLPNKIVKDLIISDKIINTIKMIFGHEKFVFHHAHGRCLPKTGNGKIWHHDYDGMEGWNIDMPKMVHVMIYPNGLTKNVSPLVIKPYSHLKLVKRNFPNQYQFEVSEQDISIYGKPGLVLFLNSALWHMRPTNLGVLERYDLNISYSEINENWNWIERNSYKNTLNIYKSESKLFH